jgi:eukaryotic-like serine/threonine-protein kinase
MVLKTQSPVVLHFGTFEVDLRAGELRKQGVRVKLQEQPFRVLSVLLQRPGEIVTREDLRHSIWPADTFVDFDNSLNTSINKLREGLGDSAERPRFIETLPRRGYRFLAPVSSGDRKVEGRTRAWKIVVAVLAVAALLAGGLFWRSRHAQRLTEKDTIVLADFANTTGDPVFDDALKQGLSVQLEQSPFLNIVSDQKVNEELQLMGRPKNERLTPDLAREVCQRIGSKAILTGSISRLGAHYAIGMNALNCPTGDSLVSEQVEADSQEHVLKALGESATKMRRNLGESLKSIQRFDAPLEQVTTPSLQALRAYSLGMKTLDTRGRTAAIPFLQRAVELDPNFAMAYARLGALYAGNDAPLSAENVYKAYELREKVTERERLYIEAHYYRDVTGEQDKAASIWEVMQQTYPREVEPYSNLAGFYGQLGNYEKALAEARGAAVGPGRPG